MVIIGKEYESNGVARFVIADPSSRSHSQEHVFWLDVNTSTGKAQSASVAEYKDYDIRLIYQWHRLDNFTDTSGTCGENLSWELIDNTLVITGTGDMQDYDGFRSPWYYHRNNITAVQLPDGLTRIGAHAFQDFTIDHIDIPQSVTSIGEAAFERCSNLNTVALPTNLKAIDSWVFRLSGLTHIELPYTLESLGIHAFAETSLTEIILPYSLTEIDGNPFNACSSDLIIKGYADSAAETFAADHSYTFIELDPIAVTAVSILGSGDRTIKDIETLQLETAFLPTNATRRKLVWSSSDADIADVDENGRVTAKALGLVSITATSVDNPEASASVIIHITEHDHLYEWTITLQPTFEVDGTKQCKCIYCGKVRAEEAIQKLTISLQDGSTWPGDASNRTGYPAGNLEQGKGFGLRGVVIASETLVSVTAHVYSSAGEDALTPVTVEPNAVSLDIQSSSINENLVFNNLPAGMYRYVVTARTVSGNEAALIDSMFSVGSALVPSLTAFPAEFYAYIRNIGTGSYVTNQLDNIAGTSFTGNANQIWHFVQQSSGAYAIFSEVNGACMDVENYSTANGTNVYAYTGGYNGTTNQLFYIHLISGNYQLSPANSNSGCMLDMDAETRNLQIWSSGTQLPQVFDIIKLKAMVSYEANGGRRVPYAIIKDYAESITISTDLPVRLGYTCIGWSETLDADNADYLPGDALSKKGDVTLYAVWTPLTSMTLPAGLTVIEEDAFAGVAASCVVCPDGLVEIGAGAFSNCPNLRQIYISESVQVISDTAFNGCPNLIDVFSVSDLEAQKFVDAHSGFRLIEVDQ